MAKRKRIKPDVLPIPKMLQDIIPAVKVYPDGIMENVKGRYSKSFIFSDINYRTASLEAKKSIAEKYKELINSLDVRSRVQITVNKRKINFEEPVIYWIERCYELEDGKIIWIYFRVEDNTKIVESRYSIVPSCEETSLEIEMSLDSKYIIEEGTYMDLYEMNYILGIHH